MLQHVLRRIGFGGAGGRQRHSRTPDRRRDRLAPQLRAAPRTTSTPRSASPEYVGVTTRGAVLAEHHHRRRAPALAVPDGAHPAAAAGEDGALLAQPLRHRLQQGRRHRRRRAGHQDDGAASRASCRRPPGQIELFRQHRARQLPRSARRGGERSGDAGLARRPAQHRAAPAGELRPRDHGAVHVRRRQLHRAGRLRGGARVHRLEPAARRRSRRRRRPATTSSSTTRPSTTRPPRRSPSRSTRTAAARSRRARPPTGCRTASTSSPRSPAIPQTARRLARKLWNFFVSEVARAGRRRSISDAARASTCRTTPACGRWCVHPVTSRWFLSRIGSSRATRGRSSSSSARSRRLGWNGFSVDARETPLDEHGADAVRAARRQRLGRSARLVLDRRRCCRG